MRGFKGLLSSRIAAVALSASLAACAHGNSGSFAPMSGVTPHAPDAPNSQNAQNVLSVQHLAAGAVVSNDHPFAGGLEIQAAGRSYFFPKTADWAVTDKAMMVRSYGRLFIFARSKVTIRHMEAASTVSADELSTKTAKFPRLDTIISSGVTASARTTSTTPSKNRCPDCVLYLDADLRRGDGTSLQWGALTTPRAKSAPALTSSGRRPSGWYTYSCYDPFNAWYYDSTCYADYYQPTYYYTGPMFLRQRQNVITYTWNDTLTTHFEIPLPSPGTDRVATGSYTDADGGFNLIFVEIGSSDKTNHRDFYFVDSDTPDSRTYTDIHSGFIPVGAPLLQNSIAAEADVI